MKALLDVNVLISRADPGHQFHRRTLKWFQTGEGIEIATCPLTENGFLRILGHPSYPGGPGSPDGAAKDLSIIRHLPGHQFIADSISLTDARIITSLNGVAPSQLTDLYLLALAVRHSVKFVTLDTRVPVGLVPGGSHALVVIPG